MSHYSYDGIYEDALETILTYGDDRGDRTGTGTRSQLGVQLRWDLEDGFPLITTKKVFMRGIVEELLWMLRGCTNNHDLVAKGVHIWDAWSDTFGNLGPIYGAQWRSWRGGDGEVIDQISWVINEIKTNPNSRRLVVSAWNVADLPKMALAPCHCLFQFFVINGKLSCHLYQRSADMFLGVPFNIASYALLTHMVAQQCDLGVGEFIWTGGDCHIYSNHHEQVKEQLSRPRLTEYPDLDLRKAASIFDYTFDDVLLMNYNPHPAIAAPVAI